MYLIVLLLLQTLDLVLNIHHSTMTGVYLLVILINYYRYHDCYNSNNPLVLLNMMLLVDMLMTRLKLILMLFLVPHDLIQDH